MIPHLFKRNCKGLEKNKFGKSSKYSYYNLCSILVPFIMVKMPPKKAFFGQVNYMDRNVHDDLLELLPESTTEPTQVKRLTSLDPRLRIADGFYDKGNWFRDAMTMQTSLVLFK